MAAWEGHARREARRRCFADKGTVCHICGHPGANDVDHIVPKSRGGSLFNPDNLAPAHGATNPCPTCGRRCNREKSTRDHAPARLSTSRNWYAGT